MKNEITVILSERSESKDPGSADNGSFDYTQDDREQRTENNTLTPCAFSVTEHPDALRV